MAARRPRNRDLAAGVGYAIAFLAAVVLVLVALWRERRGVEVVPVAGPDVAGFADDVAEALGDDLSAAPMEGPVRIVAGAVRVPGARGEPDVLAVDRLIALVDLAALDAGGVLVQAAELIRPRVFLAKASAGADWNYERVLDGLGDDGGEAGARPPRALVLRDVEIVDGLVRVVMPERRYTLTDLDAAVPMIESRPGAPGPSVRVARLNTRLAASDVEEELQVAMRNGRLQLGEGGLGFEVERVETEGVLLTALEGVWRFDVEGIGLAASGTAERVDFAVLHPFVPRLPEQGAASFRFRTEPLDGARLQVALSELSAAADGSEVAGELTVVVGGAALPEIVAIDLQLQPLELSLVRQLVDTLPLPYGGTLAGRVTGTAASLRFDLAAVLTAPGLAAPFTTDLTGEVALTADGVLLRRVVAQLQDVPLAALAAVAPGLPLEGAVTGRVELRGPPGETPIQVDVALDFAGGTATLLGQVDLTGAVPAYDLTGRLIRVPLARLLEPEVPPVLVTARFQLQGAGTALETANARFAIQGGYTGWVSQPSDTLLAQGALRGGRLVLDQLYTSLGPGSLAAEGTWSLGAPAANAIDYRVAFTELEPFGPYLPFLPDTVPVEGAVRSEGRLTGSLRQPVAAGSLIGEGLRFGAWAAETLQGTFRYASRVGAPEAELRFEGTGIETPTDADFVQAEIDLRLADRRFVVAFTGERVDEGMFELEAEGRLELEGVNSAVVRNLALDVGTDRWVLTQPATVLWSEEGVAVSGLRIEDEEGVSRVAVDGRIDFEGESRLTARLVRIPLGDILPLVGVAQEVEGVLNADVTVSGAGATPDVVAQVEVSEAVLEGVAFGQIQGELRYRDRALVADVTGALSPSGQVELDAQIPMVLRIGPTPGFELLDQAPIRAVVVTDSLALAPFGPLSPLVRDLEGVVTGRVVVAGSIATPRLDGAATLTGGAVTIPRLDKRYTNVSAAVTLENRVATIREFQAQSGGWMRGSGVVVFDELTNPVADLDVALEEFQPVGAEDMSDVQVSGEVEVNGPLFGRIVVTGEVTAEDGGVPLYAFMPEDVSPDLALLAPADPVADEAEVPPLLDRIVLDGVAVRVGDGVWFLTDRIRARLSGDLTVYREGEDMRIFGSLSGDQGTFTLEIGPIVRRFRIIDATVRFFGTPEPDPAITATASRVVPGPEGRSFEVLVNVEGTATAPRISLTTPDGTVIPESELLSVLVFGQPSVDVGAEARGVPGTALVEEALLGGIADLGSVLLEETLASDLGLSLDYFQIRTLPLDGGQAGPTFVVGKEIADDVFLTVETGVSAMFGDWATTLEWQIDREWSLELSVQPLNRRRFFLGVPLPAYTTSEGRQTSIDLQRRWSY